MEIKQKLELRRLLAPELNQSLKILSLALPDLKNLVEEELQNNPLLEEIRAENAPPSYLKKTGPTREALDYWANLLTKKPSLQDILLRQLGIFANTDLELKIGQEIIGNIDENGYLKVGLDEIAVTVNTTAEEVEKVLKIIQQFDPPGVAARSAVECLLIQLDLVNEHDPLLRKIVELHLEDVARKNYTHIAKTLKEPQEKVDLAIKKILKLNPKPGLNYVSEEIHRVIPDVTIDQLDEDEPLEITINDEDLPMVNINKDYREMLKNSNTDPQTREFLTNKLKNALALLRALSKRKFTLRRIIETIVEIQNEAIKEDLSHLKPLTFNEVAQRLNIHETTVCRAIMNKYVKLPYGVVALKAFFPSRIQDKNGQSVSCDHIKRLIRDLIEQEDRKHPLSDQGISGFLSKERNLNVSRRTVTKYREELKILNSSFRRER